jgi:hypothetical protein
VRSHKLNFSRLSTRLLAAAIVAILIGGATVGIVAAVSAGGSGAAGTVAPTAVGTRPHPSGFFASSGSGSNARSGPAPGGSVGTASSVSTSGFTLTTSAGQNVTVKETFSTTYVKGTSAASKSVVTKGATILVLGTDNNTTITATKVIVRPPKPSSKTASQVVAFNRATGDNSKTTGQIPASYKQGTGTIVTGTAANQATEAALLAYPGGVVDRVVQLSNGQYEVHNIGVNWPHHIFVNKNFKVIGAND